MITILSPNLGSNALGRALVLAELALALGEEVRILGPTRSSGPALWPPAESFAGRLTFEAIPLHRSGDYARAAATLRAALCATAGSPLIISKALPTSMGLALLAGVNPRADEVTLDIDDWEFGFRYHEGDPKTFSTPLKVLRSFIDSTYPSRLNTDAGVWCCEQLVPLFPRRIVSNTWLEERFGGAIIPHVRDGRVLDPERVSGEHVRDELALDRARPWVGFIGTPRVHKGIDVLIEALARFSGEGAPGLVLFGASKGDAVGAELIALAMERLGVERTRIKGSFPFEALAEHVAAADIVAIPSRRTMESVGQIPAKLFDAMAMAKPIVATDVNDIRAVLGGCGEIAEPGDVASMEGALRRMLERDEATRREMGARARARLLERYSVEQGSERLSRLLKLAAP